MLVLIPLLVIVATWVAARMKMRGADRTLALSVPPIQESLDPYEVAYLAGGANSVSETMIVSLTQRGALQRFWFAGRRGWTWYKNEECIRAVSGNLGTASPAERELVNWFSEPQTGPDTFWSGEKPGRLIQLYLAACEENLRCTSLLTPQYVKHAGNVTWLVGSLIIAATVLLAWGLSNSRDWDVLFMVVFFAVVPATGILGVICTDRPRQSLLGREYLVQLRIRFESYKGAVLPGNSRIIPLLVALFGLGVLEKTELEWLSKLKDNSEPPSSD